MISQAFVRWEALFTESPACMYINKQRRRKQSPNPPKQRTLKDDETRKKRKGMLQRTRRRCEGTAMGAIVLDLRPGLGIGPFSLGNHIYKYVPVQDRILIAQRSIQFLFVHNQVKFRLLLLNFTMNGMMMGPRGLQAVAIAFHSIPFHSISENPLSRVIQTFKEQAPLCMYIPPVCGLPHNQMFS